MNLVILGAGTDSCIIMATHDAQQAERVMDLSGSMHPGVLQVKKTLLLKHIFPAFVRIDYKYYHNSWIYKLFTSNYQVLSK